MRDDFFRSLADLAQTREEIFLLSANLGFKLFDDFRGRFPRRFLDMGVAEANMIGVAAGMALSGKQVYCYSIIPFLIMRAYEQIRMDVAHHGLPVKLVGVGGGFTYGLEGFSHYGIEDLALMRAMPNMNVVVPADFEEARQLAQASLDFPRPLYLRLGRSADPAVYSAKPKMRIGEGVLLKEGRDAVLIAVGSMVSESLKAAALLEKEDFSLSVVNMHTLKPLDRRLVLECAQKHRAVFTAEEHSLHGGLGSAVAEVLAESSYAGIFERFGIAEPLRQTIGDSEFLKRTYGLTGESIAGRISSSLKGVKSCR